MGSIKLNNINTIKGLLLVIFISVLSTYLASLAFFKSMYMSPLIIGIIIGIIYANTLRKKTPENWLPGIKYSTKDLLKFAIILYGFRLTFNDISEIGLAGIVVSVLMVITTLAVGYFVGTKILKMDRDTTILISSGSSICGAAAVLATESVLKSKPHKTIIAVTTVVIFGTITMFVFPLLYKAGVLPLSDDEYGILMGASIHGVSQVVAAGNAINTTVEEGAIIVKMMRVMLLSPFLILLSVWISKSRKKDSTNSDEKGNIVIPWFAIIFIVVIGLNTIISLPPEILKYIKIFDNFLLTMAMTALGMGTAFSKFKGAGLKPLYLSLTLYLWLLIGGFFITKYAYLFFH